VLGFHPSPAHSRHDNSNNFQCHILANPTVQTEYFRSKFWSIVLLVMASQSIISKIWALTTRDCNPGILDDFSIPKSPDWTALNPGILDYKNLFILYFLWNNIIHLLIRWVVSQGSQYQLVLLYDFLYRHFIKPLPLPIFLLVITGSQLGAYSVCHLLFLTYCNSPKALEVR